RHLVEEGAGARRRLATCRDLAEPPERRIAELGPELQLRPIEGPAILAADGAESVVLGVECLDDEPPARVDALRRRPSQLEGPPARKSGARSSPASQMTPIAPHGRARGARSSAGVPITTCASRSVRETRRRGKRRRTEASTRSGSQPKGASLWPPHSGQLSGRGSPRAQSRQTSDRRSRRTERATPQSGQRRTAPQSLHPSAPVERLTTRRTLRSARDMLSMARVRGRVSG